MVTPPRLGWSPLQCSRYARSPEGGMLKTVDLCIPISAYQRRSGLYRSAKSGTHNMAVQMHHVCDTAACTAHVYSINANGTLTCRAIIKHTMPSNCNSTQAQTPPQIISNDCSNQQPQITVTRCKPARLASNQELRKQSHSTSTGRFLGKQLALLLHTQAAIIADTVHICIRSNMLLQGPGLHLLAVVASNLKVPLEEMKLKLSTPTATFVTIMINVDPH